MKRSHWIRHRLPRRAFYQVEGHRRIQQWKQLIYGEDAFLAGLVSLASVIMGLLFAAAIAGAFLE